MPPSFSDSDRAYAVPPSAAVTGRNSPPQNNSSSSNSSSNNSNNSNANNAADSPNNNNPMPPAKRRRVALACGTCRNRKSRCDGSRPKCSMCRELGYVAQLEHRIEQIEEFIRPLREARAEASLAKPYALHDETNLPRQHEASAGVDRTSTSQVPPHAVNANGPEIGEVDNSENSIDGMAAINFTDEEDCGFFVVRTANGILTKGPSSNIAFMRHISRAITQVNSRRSYVPSVSPNDKYGGGMMSVSRSQPAPESDSTKRNSRGVNIYALPSESRTWYLIQKYFLKTGQLLPFIHEQSFCETYFQMKRDNFTKVRRTWLGLLNIVLAIATSLCNDGEMPAEKRIQESDVYYQRANALCDRESKRNTSLEMVQYLLILGQYLQGTQKSVQAWNTHGLAITAAFQLGLHSPDANRGFSPLEREIRKRTWFGCVLLDRTLSMTFGRPCIIPQSYVKLEMPLHDMQMLGQSPQLESGPFADGCFFTAAIQLYVVMYNVIDTCYGQNLGFDNSQTTFHIVSRVLELDRQLEEWQHQLLPTLGLYVTQKPLTPADIENMKPESLIFERFNIVLSLRYHNLRILLHRKFLEKFLETAGSEDSSNPEKKILRQVGISSVQNCVESAVIIISTVHTIASSSGWQRDLLGAWNYSLYYTFNAGLVIFGALLVSSKESAHNPAAWETVERSRPYLDLAAEALRCLDSGNRVIERCVEYLSQLSLALAALTSNGTPSFNNNGGLVGNYANGNGYPAGMVSPPIAQTAAASANMANRGNPFPLSQSPVGIDLGEFMIDSDLDFLGRLFFDLSRNGDGTQSQGAAGGLNGSSSAAAAGPVDTTNSAHPQQSPYNV
ncbi:hypothetical protein T310_5522 [Rasamsonia emersonii CBS 393.64]|uniref:Zn(2)-C6 fungal-type domain-containing protein n=1 Tax=Rasamsonia emersonii (strain ATCC 16479 / CBS 393.64 / IMI 116815) TaxID=1408163 RepID=A0A0F4YRI9_RASE3|nr:hypothetical protein T310_5522 [Rasamsonia emersonii CBS 393.64]KKA20471.1 hypothetical protein T310_5522 [Rasamsonia emersonii CBS 393.64]